MKSYKSLICALAAVLAVSGISAKISYEYYTALQSAKRRAEEYKEQTKQAEDFLEDLVLD